MDQVCAGIAAQFEARANTKAFRLAVLLGFLAAGARCLESRRGTPRISREFALSSRGAGGA